MCFYCRDSDGKVLDNLDKYSTDFSLGMQKLGPAVLLSQPHWNQVVHWLNEQVTSAKATAFPVMN
jgi:hypothetical protein